MFWFLSAIALLIGLLVGLWVCQKFYAKASLNSAFVRTGFGGQRVVLGGGCFALPILHQVQRVHMGAMSVAISRRAKDALLAADQLRADVDMEFEFQVVPSDDGVAAAAQALGRRVERGGDGIDDLVNGPLVAAMQNAASTKKLADLHTGRAEFAADIQHSVEPILARLGLVLISASVLRLDQSDISQTDENNAFDAQGMRRHAELIAEQRRERVRIETETDIAVRESNLAKHQRQLEIERAEREASINSKATLDRLEAEANAATEKVKSSAQIEAERSRIEAEQKIKSVKVSNDEALRRSEMTAILGLEETKIENEAHLSKLRAAEFKTQAAEEAARVQLSLAAEDAQAKKELAIAKREHETAEARLQKDLQLSDLQTKSDADTLITRTKAEASAKEELARAELAKAEAEAKARTAMIAAENAMDPALMAMRLEEHRLNQMPEIMTQVMKPVEKIDSIKINHIGGLGSSDGASGGADTAFGSAMDQILGMAVKLPVLKQMGEEIGFDFDANLAGRTADYANRIKKDKN